MTPFHLKLYYLLTDKNTGAGQSSQSGSHHYSSYHHGHGHHHHHHHYGGGGGGGANSKSKQKMMMNQGGGMNSSMFISNIDQVSMPKKLLVLTNQQEVKESRQIEARKLNVSLIGKKKKKAIEQNQVGQDETQQACLSLLDYCAERAS